MYVDIVKLLQQVFNKHQSHIGADFGLRDGRARTAREAPNHFLSVSSASATARGATTRTEVMRAGSNMGPGGQGEGGAQWAWT